MVVAAGSRSASTTLRVTAVDDVEADGGETIVIGTSLAGRAVTEATLTLREPAGPLLVVHVDGEALAPSSACGGFGRLCLPETSLQAGLTLELRHPPAHAYRKCRVEVGDGPTRRARRSGAAAGATTTTSSRRILRGRATISTAARTRR